MSETHLTGGVTMGGGRVSKGCPSGPGGATHSCVTWESHLASLVNGEMGRLEPEFVGFQVKLTSVKITMGVLT